MEITWAATELIFILNILLFKDNTCLDSVASFVSKCIC